jgi:hypothetical protein
MTIISLNREEIAKAREFAHKINSLNKNPNGYINGFRTKDKNNKFKVNFVGKLGEITVGKFLDLPVNFELKKGNDGKYDFIHNGETVDVKTSSYPKGKLYFYNKLYFKADVAILVVPVIKGEYTNMRIVGWIRKEDFMRKCFICNFGHHDNVCVHNRYLKPFS